MNTTSSEKKKEDWMNSKWRPMMGWSYMATCICDFVLFPILWSLIQTLIGQSLTQWQPITLQGAGLYHIAMGAVLGIAAFGRTQEKLNGANNGGLGQPGTPLNSFSNPVQPVSPSPILPAAPTNTFGSSTPLFNQAPAGNVTEGFGGKKAPPSAPEPVL